MTTKSIQASGGDYATIAAWEGAMPADLVSTTQTWIGEMADETFSEADLDIAAGVTTSALYYPELRPQSGTAFNGVAGNGPVIDEGTGTAVTNGWVLKLSADYTRLTNIELTNSQTRNTGNSSIFVGVDLGDFDFIRVVGCIVHDLDASDHRVFGVHVRNSYSNTYYVINNIIYELGYSTIGSRSGGVVVGLWNATSTWWVIGNSLLNAAYTAGGDCLAFSGDNGSANTGHYYNNIVIGSGRDDFKSINLTGSTLNGSHNGSGDLTASVFGSNEQESLVAATEWVNVTGGSEDFHLKPGATCVGAGSDRGTTPPNVELDIDGYDRDAGGDTWDIGADQTRLILQAATIAATGIIAIIKATTKPLIIVATGIVGESQFRIFSRTLATVATGIPLIVKSTLKDAFAIVVTGIVGESHFATFNRTMAIVATAPSTLVKKTTKLLTIVATAVPVVVKKTIKDTFAIVATVPAVLAASYRTFKTFSIVATVTSILATLKTPFVAGGAVRKVLGRILRRRRL